MTSPDAAFRTIAECALESGLSERFLRERIHLARLETPAVKETGETYAVNNGNTIRIYDEESNELLIVLPSRAAGQSTEDTWNLPQMPHGLSHISDIIAVLLDEMSKHHE